MTQREQITILRKALEQAIDKLDTLHGESVQSGGDWQVIDAKAEMRAGRSALALTALQ